MFAAPSLRRLTLRRGVVADLIAAVEVSAPPEGAVVRRARLLGVACSASTTLRWGGYRAGMNSSNAKTRSGNRSRTSSIRSSLVSQAGSASGDSLHLLVRWEVMPRRASRQRNASQPIRMLRPWTLRR